MIYGLKQGLYVQHFSCAEASKKQILLSSGAWSSAADQCMFLILPIDWLRTVCRTEDPQGPVVPPTDVDRELILFFSNMEEGMSIYSQFNAEA